MSPTARVKAENEALRATIAAYVEGLANLRRYVDSDKFKGVDVVDGSRKDWMATADLLRWESGEEWWFTWSGVGMASCEVGATCGSCLEAEANALLHFFGNASIPIAVCDG